VNLQELTAPTGVDGFLAHVQGREFGHFKGDAKRFDGLFGWADLNDILVTQRLDDSQLQVLWGERRVHSSVYTTTTSARGHQWQTLRPRKLNALLGNGATLRLRRVDQLHRKVRELAAGLERELRDPVHVNAYVNCGPAERSAVHHDDHDVLVLQVDGAKHWRIYGPASPQPLPDDGDRAPLLRPDPAAEPAAELRLEAGDVLYVPRGVWHSAEAVDGPSLHLTVGMWRATGADLLEWIVAGLRESELLRADIPRGDETLQRQYVAQVRELLLAQLADSDLLHRMFRARDGSEPADVGFALPVAAHPAALAAELTPAHTIRFLARRAVVEPHDDQITLRAGGQVHRFGARLAPILEQLVAGNALPVADLISRCHDPDHEAEARRMLGELASDGLVDVT
jgi:hypothetical protein